MIIPVSFKALSHITHNIRERDKQEISGILGHCDPEKLVRETLLATAFGKAGICIINNEPVSIAGVSPVRNGVWSAWAFGTDNWNSGVISLTRFILRDLHSYLDGKGAHRAQCESHIAHTDAHKWLSLLGARHEGILRGYGADGSDYVMFSWTRN